MDKRKSNRLKHYDYSLPGYYFITICTKDNKRLFGEVEDGKVFLNQLGQVAESFIKEIPNHYDGASIDQFVVMPNHIHIIIVLHNERTEQCSVPTDRRCGALLSQIVKSYKNVVTKGIRKKYSNNDFSWQRSFFDHVIRNEEGLGKIREYIRNNPVKWELDEYYSGDLGLIE